MSVFGIVLCETYVSCMSLFGIVLCPAYRSRPQYQIWKCVRDLAVECPCMQQKNVVIHVGYTTHIASSHYIENFSLYVVSCRHLYIAYTASVLHKYRTCELCVQLTSAACPYFLVLFCVLLVDKLSNHQLPTCRLPICKFLNHKLSICKLPKHKLPTCRFPTCKLLTRKLPTHNLPTCKLSIYKTSNFQTVTT